MILLFPFAVDLLSAIMMILPGVEDPVLDINSTPIGLAVFHTSFNVINALIFLGLIKYLVQLSELTVSSKRGKQSDEFSMISTSAVSPELAALSIKKEISKFGERLMLVHQDLISLINSIDKKEVKKLTKGIKKYKEKSDETGTEISNFITKILGSRASKDTSLNLRSFLDVCNDLERLGDIYNQIARDFQKKKGDNIWFTPQQRNSLLELSEMTREALVIMNKNISSRNRIESERLDQAKQINEQFSYNRELLRDEYLKNKDLVEENIKGSIIYVNIMTLLQTLNNHILHVSESLSREL